MKNLFFLLAIGLVLFMKPDPVSAQLFDPVIKLKISAADDTISGVDTAYLTADFCAGQDYGYTLTVTNSKVTGTVSGAGLTFWGRNKDTETWTQLTSSNYFTAMQGSDALIDGTNQLTYLIPHHRFTKVRVRVISATGTVACTGNIYLQGPPVTSK